MALNTQMSDAAANAACAAVIALANSGSIRIYTGTQPANANTAIGAQTLLATLLSVRDRVWRAERRCGFCQRDHERECGGQRHCHVVPGP